MRIFLFFIMVRESLKKVGLVDEEIDLYLLLLRLGSSKATTLSKELGIARTTVYRFLGSLQSKGIVSENVQSNVKFFYPVEPKRIPEILKERAEEIVRILPKLDSFKGQSFENANVELHKGKEGIKSILKDIIRENKDYIFIGSSEDYFKDFDLDIFSQQWIKKVEKENIFGRILCSEDQKLKVAKNEEYRFLPNELISEISTWTYGNKVAIFIFSSPSYVISINNKLVADGNRKSFNYLWKTAKKPSKKFLEKSKI